MQVIVMLLFLAVVASLLKAMFHMGRGDEGRGMVRALAARIILSMTLFGLLYLSWHFGWVHPQGAP